MKRYFKEFLLGFLVGTANLLPGISGGTIVFISGRYEDFVKSLGDLMRLKLKRDEMIFLINLGIGAAVAVIVLSNALNAAMKTHPKELMSLFAGLIMGGLMSLGTGMRMSIKNLVFIALGSSTMIVLDSLSGGGLSPNPLNLVLGGAVAGAAMILPGISGSTMLVLIGLYGYALYCISSMKLDGLIFLGTGAVLGIFSVSLALKGLMEKFKNETVAFLFGLTLVGLIYLLVEEISLLYLILGIVGATTLERVMKW